MSDNQPLGVMTTNTMTNMMIDTAAYAMDPMAGSNDMACMQKKDPEQYPQLDRRSRQEGNDYNGMTGHGALNRHNVGPRRQCWRSLALGMAG